ncbi:Cell division control protein 7 [Dispira simplex]|nr:Cell division control protein 7 [Dispira simplex]
MSHVNTEQTILESGLDETSEDTALPQPRTNGHLPPSKSPNHRHEGEPDLGEVVQSELGNFLKAFPSIQRQYRIVGKIGEGTFSCVYKALDLEYHRYDNSYWDLVPTADTAQSPNEARLPPYKRARVKSPTNPCATPSSSLRKYVALKKIYVTSSPSRIANEIRILKDLSGHVNIGPLITALRYQDQVLVVLPYFEHHDFRDYYRTMDLTILRNYLQCLFRALEFTHRHHIIHRDVKPSNFLFNVYTQHGVLVDFGLAEYAGQSSATPTADLSKTPQRSSAVASNPMVTPVRNNVFASPAKPGDAPQEPYYRQRLKESALKYYQPQRTPQAGDKSGSEQRGTLTAQSSVGPRSNSTSLPVNIPTTPMIIDHKNRPGVLRRDARPSVKANRAGTRGFRAPEVLLKVVQQTPAIDIWSAGVIILSIMTHRFPFFNSSDDQEALLEMGVLFGKQEIKRVAALHDRSFFTNVPTVRDSGVMFERLVKVYNPDGYHKFPTELFDLVQHCFMLNPKERITAADALNHPFLRD